MEKNKPEVVICACSSSNHNIIIHYDEEDNLAYCHVHLMKLPFWKRIVYAFRYVFGFKSPYGAFEEFIINEENAVEFQKIIKKIQ